MKKISRRKLRLNGSGILKSSMLALSAVAVIGCGGGSTTANNAVGTLSEQTKNAPVLTGFSTAVPANVKPGDAVGYVGSAYASEKSRAKYGNVSYTLSGKDADKFFIDQDDFIRAKQYLQTGTTYELELTGNNQSGSSKPIAINITCGSILTDANGLKSDRCNSDSGGSCPIDNLPWLPLHPEGERIVAQLPGDAALFGIKDDGLDGDHFEIITEGDNTYLAFKAEPDFENPTDGENWKSAAQDNDYKVTVLFYEDDSRKTICNEHSMCVRVTDQEEPCPTIFNTIHINENSTYVTNAATTLGSFSIDDGADASLFKFVGDELQFITAPDYENPGSSAGTNEYIVNLFDGAQGKQDLKIVIDNIPDTPPIVTGFSALIPETTLAHTKLSSIDSSYKVDVSENPPATTQGENSIQFIVLKDQTNSTVTGLDFYVDIDGEVYTNKDMTGLTGSTIMQATPYNESGWGDPTEIVIEVEDVANKGATIHPLFANIDENSVGGTTVGEVRILDLGDLNLADFDQLKLFDYDYGSDFVGPNTSPFELALDGTGTKLMLKLKDSYNPADLDYELRTFYTLKMQMKDTVTGLTSNQACVYVQVNDVDENDPIFVSDEPVTKNIDENVGYIGTFKTFDETYAVNFAKTGGADMDKFKIIPVQDSDGNENSFELWFDDTAFPPSVVLNTGIHLPDFENPIDSDNDNVYVVQVKGTDSVGLPEGPHSKTVEYQIHVQNVVEVVPEILNRSGIDYVGPWYVSPIGNLVISNTVDGPVDQFELVSQTGPGTIFSVDSATGRINVTANPADTGDYQIVVRAHNDAGWGPAETLDIRLTLN